MVGVRMPEAMRDELRAQAEEMGQTMSERIEWLIETQALRKR